jgi:hypothetical protein
MTSTEKGLVTIKADLKHTIDFKERHLNSQLDPLLTFRGHLVHRPCQQRRFIYKLLQGVRQKHCLVS